MKTRNYTLDFVRAIATIMVLFSHILQKYGFTDNILFNICFSVQIPLFMMVAGYAFNYSKEITNVQILLEHLKKRINSLLKNWLIWSILFYLFFFSTTPVKDHIVRVAWEMEDAVWFLFSLWTIDLIYSFVTLVVNKCKVHFKRSKIIELILICVFLIVPILSIGFIGVKMGFSFLGIKYTLYYLIYFTIGNFVAKYQIFLDTKLQMGGVVLTVALILFALSMNIFHIYDMPDDKFNIIIRFVISILGCYCCIKIAGSTPLKILKNPIVLYIGKNSLEIYVIQLFTLHFLKTMGNQGALNAIGFGYCILDFIVVSLLSFLIIEIIKTNNICSKILFSKSKF